MPFFDYVDAFLLMLLIMPFLPRYDAYADTPFLLFTPLRFIFSPPLHAFHFWRACPLSSPLLMRAAMFTFSPLCCLPIDAGYAIFFIADADADTLSLRFLSPLFFILLLIIDAFSSLPAADYADAA